MTNSGNNKITRSILTMAAERGPEQSVCPSEIARALFPADWRSHMQQIREKAIALHKMGKVEITQKGVPVDPDHIKGPVRIKIVSNR